MMSSDRIHIPPRTALRMIGRYARMRLAEQARAVAFIVAYLLVFQLFVVGSPPAHAVRIALGLGFVTLGLALFLEGLLLGLMPLGEQVGVRLPRRFGVAAIVIFGLLLGLGSTLAEPAIAALRVAGMRVTAWDAPLLYRLIEVEPDKLVLAIGAGVGAAVGIGMLRYAMGWSIKSLVLVIVPVLLLTTAWCARHPSLGAVLGLAWDAGAVTTGAVTVPLVLALGIGVARSLGKQEGDSGGFGIIMLASALPVLGVLVLAMLLQGSTPMPVSEEVFFSAAHREQALRLLGDQEGIERHAFRRGGFAARRTLLGDEATHRRAIEALADPAVRRARLGDMRLEDWAEQRASERERAWLIHPNHAADGPTGGERETTMGRAFRMEAGSAMRALLPLTLLLLLVLFVLLRERPRRTDEFVLGIALALVGMTLLTAGIRTGLAPLGDEVGRPLPRLFRGAMQETGRVRIEPFDLAALQSAFTESGETIQVFHIEDSRGAMQAVPFDPDRFDEETGRYEHIRKRPPLFNSRSVVLGAAWVLLFAFGLGYGTTLAEPALSALGRTVEEITVGTIRRTGVVRAVSIGVGVGLVVGVARILFGIHNLWLILPPYLLLIPLTLLSEEDFAGIAWDCGGVTTGIITVPLVLAMGLSIGGELGVADGFGILAMASVYPITSVMIYGLIIRRRQRLSMEAKEMGDE